MHENVPVTSKEYPALSMPGYSHFLYISCIPWPVNPFHAQPQEPTFGTAVLETTESYCKHIRLAIRLHTSSQAEFYWTSDESTGLAYICGCDGASWHKASRRRQLVFDSQGGPGGISGYAGDDVAAEREAFQQDGRIQAV